ncbi:LacI family DNA-binding transcriptional regulator [Paenibacillus caui]|uniref:LacI family DNA-binding transcriptional regulator n=1 Tax=Paenibacillus caui TaxID=2873927 RepID=UPI001CA98BBE|nr:LacI family DNA-binding transcriptional regulator [Paenibacillus caui]
MAERVTIQQIADALGLSRNTVSKALNNHPQIPDTTKEKVVQKATEMKYKNFHSLRIGNIALLARGDINAISFYSETIKGMETRLRAEGFNLILSLVSQEDIKSRRLPANIHSSNVDGIVCIEIFDKSYIQTVLNTNIPTVFIDFIPDTVFTSHKYDIILIENEYPSFTLTEGLIKRGHQHIGFIGDYNHCRSFYERWLGFDRALRNSGAAPGSPYSITLPDNNPYLHVEWMANQLKQLPSLPTAFVCANDDIGIAAIRALKEMNYRIPSDIEITGFDDIANAEIIDPPLTTVHTYPYDLGTRVVDALLVRIEQPERNNETIYLETIIIKRGSTK